MNRIVCFIGLNPSTADEEEDDPTVRRELDYSRRWGYRTKIGSGARFDPKRIYRYALWRDHYRKVNLFGLRATDPLKLLTHEEPTGDPENFETIVDVAERSDLVIAAWGEQSNARLRRMQRERAKRVCAELTKRHVKLHCLAFTKSGSPRHPLYLPKHCDPIPWYPDFLP